MENTIIISSFAKYALAEADGIKLREKMETFISNNTPVVIDFANINLFATPFFNSSFGYYFYQLKEEKYNNLIKVTNLSKLGLSTYSHSIENAKMQLERHINSNDINIEEIIKNSLEDN